MKAQTPKQRRRRMLLKLLSAAGGIGLWVGILTSNTLDFIGLHPQQAPGIFGAPLFQYGIGGVFLAFLIWFLQRSLKRSDTVTDARLLDRDERIRELMADKERLRTDNMHLKEQNRSMIVMLERAGLREPPVAPE